jgi:hypothetical protein
MNDEVGSAVLVKPPEYLGGDARNVPIALYTFRTMIATVFQQLSLRLKGEQAPSRRDFGSDNLQGSIFCEGLTEYCHQDRRVAAVGWRGALDLEYAFERNNLKGWDNDNSVAPSVHYMCKNNVAMIPCWKDPNSLRPLQHDIIFRAMCIISFQGNIFIGEEKVHAKKLDPKVVADVREKIDRDMVQRVLDTMPATDECDLLFGVEPTLASLLVCSMLIIDRDRYSCMS